MITLGTTGAIDPAVDPQDGRKGIDGLAGAVAAALGRDPASGNLFVLRNRRGTGSASWPGRGTGSPCTSAGRRPGRSRSRPPTPRT